MRTITALSAAAVVGFIALVSAARAGDWKKDKVWHDGLAEKAVYAASRVVYGEARSYEAVFFTNKEQHDRATLTKAENSRDTVEVWKHNQIEEIPTPNYRYHYVATSHLTTADLSLTRLDCSSQEFCGASFRQYQSAGKDTWDYWAFSYFPEAGRRAATIKQESAKVVAADSLPLFLRDFDFDAKGSVRIALLSSQKSNRHTPAEPAIAELRNAGEEDGAHKVELLVEGKVFGSYWMAKDRLHVMVKYRGADGQQYDLKELKRVNYWTIK